MKAKTFNYKGYTFKPIGNILGGWLVKNDNTDFRDVLKIDGYTHADFYKVAKKHHASVDVFEVNGKLVMPCNAGFVAVIQRAKIKDISEYERWYQ